MFTAEQRLEQLKLGSNRVRFETCWFKSDNSTPAFFDQFKVSAADQLRTPEFIEHMIEIPHGWTNVTYHSASQSSSQQYLDTILLNGLILGGTVRKQCRPACYFSAAHPQKSKAVFDHKSEKPQIVLTFIISGIPTRFMKLIWSKHKTWVYQSVTLSFTLETFQ